MFLKTEFAPKLGCEFASVRYSVSSSAVGMDLLYNLTHRGQTTRSTLHNLDNLLIDILEALDYCNDINKSP